MKISRHHSRILDAIAHEAIGEISTVIRERFVKDHWGVDHTALADTLMIIRPILDKWLRRAYGWGADFQEAPLDKPVEKGGLDLGFHLKDLGLAKSDDSIPKVRG